MVYRFLGLQPIEITVKSCTYGIKYQWGGYRGGCQGRHRICLATPRFVVRFPGRFPMSWAPNLPRCPPPTSASRVKKLPHYEVMGRIFWQCPTEYPITNFNKLFILIFCVNAYFDTRTLRD
ncbi:Uncharacterized protein APZ42_023246 [Daphnia magna]|uniref:Uncharacterized protein n=1 Tax=Daphnia magna TaxID=35525 RepID=A0A164V3Z2_9CRUS|nr:Uncharacterized protein APZ42_023246 [Daphnia magna]